MVFTQDPTLITQAERVILPGVGAAGYAMSQLRAAGLVPIIQSLTQPVLGICVGMQVLFDASAENDTEGLGIIPGTVEAFEPAADRALPHMGWNAIHPLQTSSLFTGLPEAAYVYYVHSYQVPVSPYTIATTHYGQSFSAMVQHRNFAAMQFHPEKSAAIGHQLLKNFLTWEPPCN